MLAVVLAASFGFFPGPRYGTDREVHKKAVNMLGFEYQAHPNVTEIDARIPTRDGFELYTRIFIPPGGADKKMPLLYQQVPYAKEYHEVMVLPLYYAFLAGNVSAVLAIQETRGRYNSTGNYTLFRNSAEDGQDTADWVAKQSWSNGVIWPWGISAMGIKGFLTDKSNFTVRGQVIGLGALDMFDPVTFRNGALNTGIMLQILPFMNLSISELAPMVTAHQGRDEWWDACSVKDDDYESVKFPLIQWASWYDIFGQSSLNAFHNYRTKGSGWWKGTHRLVIDPLGHCGLQPSNTTWRYNQTAVKMIETLWVVESIAMATVFSDSASTLSNTWALAKWSLLASRLPRIIMYVMGSPDAPANYLTGVDDWPATTNYSLFLSPEGKLSNNPPPPGTQASYIYDPTDPVPTTGGHLFQSPMWTCGDVDILPLMSRHDIKSFTSAPLQAPLAVTGRLWVELEVSTNCTDTDFVAFLSDVYPNGTRVLVSDGVQRMRWRNKGKIPVGTVPGQHYTIAVDLWSTSFVFGVNHSVGLDVTSSSWPNYRPNNNINEDIKADQIFPMTGVHNETALNSVHFGVSRIVLPSVKISDLPPLNMGDLPFPIPTPPPPPTLPLN